MQGLQIFNEVGEVVLDTSDSLTRTLGSIVTNSSGSGSVVDINLTKGIPWYVTFVTRKTVDPQGFNVSIVNDTLTWWFDYNYSWQYPHKITYGVY